jgi:hypothetical protein
MTYIGMAAWRGTAGEVDKRYEGKVGQADSGLRRINLDLPRSGQTESLYRKEKRGQ